MLMDMKHVLISVYDKTGIVKFAKELQELGFMIISTSKTFKNLQRSKVRFVKHVSEFTEFPEILEGRIKTLHPKLLGGILALRERKEHLEDLDKFGIKPIDMVVCNLYPFEEVTKGGADIKTVLENIDIGGPNMIRAAAKNFENVVIIVNPTRYDQVVYEYKEKGEISAETRKVLALEAFKETTSYDDRICRFLERIQ